MQDIFQSFQPAYTAGEVRNYLRLFRANPRYFTKEQGLALQRYADYYKIPYKKNEFDYAFNILDAVKQLGEGFLTGFSTIQVGKPSLNPYENILRSIGELAGFVGYIPAKPIQWGAKGIGLGAKALGLGEKFLPTIAKFAKAENAAKLAGSITSVPMWAAGKITKQVGGFVSKQVAKAAMEGSSKALGSVTKFLSAQTTQHIVSHAFHLGVASSVSNWRYGVDQMMKSFVHGSVTGAVFSGIGEVFKKGMLGVGEPIPLEHLSPSGKPIWSKISEAQKADVVLKMIASSAYSGLPATLKGASTPQQVYEYLLGAYFGYTGVNSKTAEAQKFLSKYQQVRHSTKYTGEIIDPAISPELKNSYNSLSKEARVLADKYINRTFAVNEIQGVLASIRDMYGKDEINDAKALAERFLEELSVNMKQEDTAEESPLTPMQKTKVKIANTALDVMRYVENAKYYTINKYTEDIGDSIEIDNVIEPVRDFYNDYILPANETFSNANPKHREDVYEIEKVWNTMQPYGEKKDYVPKFLDYLKTGFNIEITPEVERYWRYQSNDRRFNKTQQLLQYNKDKMTVELQKGELDGAGNRRILRRPDIPETEIYRQYYEEKTGKKIPFAPTRYLEHGYMYNKKAGKTVSVKGLSNLGILPYERATIFESQFKEGFYPISGRNDKQMIIFQKYHPFVEYTKSVEIDKMFKELDKLSGGVYSKDLKDTIAEFSVETGKGRIGFTSDRYKRVVLSNAFYDLAKNGFKPTVDNFKKLFDAESGLINTAAAFNKRKSIWDTNGIPVDSEVFYQKSGRKKGEPIKAIIVEVPIDTRYNPADVKSPATAFQEQWDGKDIMRPELLKAMLDTIGVPSEGNIGKMFIVSPNEKYGALLNKSSTSAAHEVELELMDSLGVDHILFTTTAKQKGSRKVGKLKYDPAYGRYEVEGDEIFELYPEDYKVLTTKKIDSHLLENKNLAIQIAFNMIPEFYVNNDFKPLTPEQLAKAKSIADEFYRDVVKRSVDGEEVYNLMLQKYLMNPEQNKDLLNELVNNHDKIGLKELSEALRNPNSGEFISNLLGRLSSNIGNYRIEEAIESLGTPEEIDELYTQGVQFQTAINRFIEINGNNMTAYAHKFANTSLSKLLSSYFVKRITKPTIGNSAEAIIGTFGLHEQNSYARRMVNDDNVFYLGRKFRNKKIKSKELATALKKKGDYVTLGELWDNMDELYRTHEEALDDVFTALVSRVPIDSPSGSQTLEFAGFTLRDDYEIMLHPRTMRFLGGADSDIDTAHIYFGGDGGFKKAWKDLIRTQKYEHGRKVTIPAEEIMNRNIPVINNYKDEIDFVKGFVELWDRKYWEGSHLQSRAAREIAEVYAEEILKGIEPETYKGFIYRFIENSAWGKFETDGTNYPEVKEWQDPKMSEFVYNDMIDAVQTTFKDYLKKWNKKKAKPYETILLDTENRKGIIDPETGRPYADHFLVDKSGEPKISPTQAKQVKGINISSRESGLGKLLTNPGNNLTMVYRGKRFRNAEHAYQTWKSGKFDEVAYKSKAFKPRGKYQATKEQSFPIMVDILTEKLKQYPQLVEEINQRGGLEFLSKSTHIVFKNKTNSFWETSGQNKFIEALKLAYQSVAKPQQKDIPQPVKPVQKLETPNLHLSPLQRIKASEIAYKSRDTLGIAAVNKSVIASAYLEALKKPKLPPFRSGVKVLDRMNRPILDETGKPLYIWIQQTPKKGYYNIERFKRMSTEAMRLGSDPSDHGEMVSKDEVFYETAKTLFDFKPYIGDVYGRPTKENANRDLVEENILHLAPGDYKKSITSKISMVRRALFSKDFLNARPFSELERKIMLKAGIDFVGESPQTFLGKFGLELNKLSWKTDFTDIIEPKAYDAMFSKLYEDLKNKRLPKVWNLLKTIAPSKFVKFVKKVGLNRIDVQERIVTNPKDNFVVQIWSNPDFKKVISKIGVSVTAKEFASKPRDVRAFEIEKIIQTANDFISNDINLIAQVYNVNDVMEKGNITKKRALEITLEAKKIKKAFSKYFKQGKMVDDSGQPLINFINKEIIRVKKTLTPEESLLFDQIMLSPFATGQHYTHARLAFELPTISDKSILLMNQRMNGIYEELLNYEGLSQQQIPDKHLETAVDVLNGLEGFDAERYSFNAPRLINSGNGQVLLVEGKPFSLDMLHLINAKSVKLSNEIAKEVEDLKTTLSQIPAINLQTLPGVFKYLSGGKDLRFADMADIRAFNNKLKDIAYASNDAELKKYFTYMFPDYVSKKLLKYSMNFKLEKYPYINEKGELDSHGYALKPMETISFIQDAVHQSGMRAESLREKMSQVIDGDLGAIMNSMKPEEFEALTKASFGLFEYQILDGEKKLHEDAAGEYRRNKEEADKIMEEYGGKKFQITFGTEDTRTLTGKEIVDYMIKLHDKYKLTSELLTNGDPKELEKYIVREKLVKGNIVLDARDLWFSPNRKRYRNLIQNGFKPSGNPLTHAYSGDIVYNYIKYYEDLNKSGAIMQELPFLKIGLNGKRKIIHSMLKTVFNNNLDKLEFLNDIKIEDTGLLSGYIPHYFDDPEAKIKGLKTIVKAIEKNPNYTLEQKRDKIRRIVEKQKMDDIGGLIRDLDDELMEYVAMTDAKEFKNKTAAWLAHTRKLQHQMSRNAHIPGWTKDFSVWHRHFANIARYLYKLDAQLSAHNKIYEFFFDNVNKLGLDLTKRHVDFYRMYTQSAMGYGVNIPKHVLEDEQMKIKGTLFEKLNNKSVAKLVTNIGRKLGLLKEEPEIFTKPKSDNQDILKLEKIVESYIYGNDEGADMYSGDIAFKKSGLPLKEKNKYLAVYGKELMSAYAKEDLPDFIKELKKEGEIFWDKNKKRLVYDDGTDAIKYLDNFWTERRNYGKKLYERYKKYLIPKTELPTTKVQELLSDKFKKYEFTEADLMWLSNMEAKYELATLLSHPKTYVTNIYGGEGNNLINAGWKNLRDARSIDYLNKMNPDWKTMKDVEKTVTQLGVVEEFIIHQIGLNPKLRNGKLGKFIDEALEKIKGNPDLSDKSLLEIAKKYQISESVLNKAAWFMRKSERILRRDSFVTHLIQEYKNWGERLPYDHPFLLKKALDGVKATQFLYTAAFRPMFANTAVGKILTRFQLWAWNNVRLKRMIINDAANLGFMRGTPEFDRFKRMALIDIFSLALANAFMYSIFESALPAPWNWIQDFADWIFGSKKEREKAFFGAYPTEVAPLQMITPPAFRLVPVTIKALVRNDFSEISDYQIWTIFPFGRIGRDIFGKGNIIQNPYRIIEKSTGIPYRQMAKFITESRKEEPFVGM